MKKILVVLMVLSVAAFACGGGGGTSETCAFDVNDFTNGANATAATSVWNCLTSGVSGSYTFAFYNDGAGYSSAVGAFTWEEVGCREVDVVAYNGTNQITDIEGSVASSIGTFTQHHPDGTTSTSSCTIESL